jgi:hypothetical protein
VRSQVYVGGRSDVRITTSNQHFSLLRKEEGRSSASDDQAGASYGRESAEASRSGWNGDLSRGRGSSPGGARLTQKVVHQRIHRGITGLGMAGQRSQDNGLQLRRQLGVETPGRGRQLAHSLEQQFDG